MTAPVLQTERLILRVPSAEDFDAWGQGADQWRTRRGRSLA
ncbi:hypothetical protein [Sphingomonas sp. Leaf21]|nr:hypothetical protein [Sphingomonas sp. Leaf21]